METIDITTLQELREFVDRLPVGSLSTVSSSDMLDGNFDQGEFTFPDGRVVTITYTGP